MTYQNNSFKSRLGQAEYQAAQRVSAVPHITQEQRLKILDRLADLTVLHGGSEGQRQWLEDRQAQRGPSVFGVDRGRLNAKLTAMARIMTAETPEDKERGWAELDALGRG